MPSIYISISQAAGLLGKPYYHVHRLIRKKRLKAEKIGWAWMVSRSAVESLKKERKAKSKK